MLSKPSSLILVLWAPLILYYIKPTERPWRLALISVGLLIITAAIVFAENKWIYPGHSAIRNILYSENPLAEQKDLFIHIGVALNSLWFYLWKLFFPHPLGWYYGFN